MMDFAQQRSLMIERQLRTVGVLDAKLLAAFQTTPRHDFVPEAYRALAYADIAIPLDHQQTMLQPGIQAQLIQALAIKPTDHVLEVGTGSGYLTAILAQLAHRVTSVEIFDDLLMRAEQKLRAAHISNVTLRCRDYAEGPKEGIAHYDAILINGALATVPASFYQVLKPRGRMVAIIGQMPSMSACVLTQAMGQPHVTRLFETSAPYLVNATMPDAFHF